MSLIINETLRKLLCKEGKNILYGASVWSINSSRGAKSFQELPRAPELSIFGSAPDALKAGGPKHMIKYVDELHKTLGPIFMAKLKNYDMVFIADADANIEMYRAEGQYPARIILESWKAFLEESGKRRGLFFMNDENWKNTRNVFNQIILIPGSMENHVQRVSKVCQDFMDIWKINPPTSLTNHLYSWNVECFGEIAFGKRLGFMEKLKSKERNSEHVKEEEFVEATSQVFVESAEMYLWSVEEAKLLKNDTWNRFSSAMTTVLEYGEMYVQNAIKDCKVRNPSEAMKECIVFKALFKHKVDEETLTAVFIDMFLASPDTTTHAACWALYLLGRNPEVANKAREEIFSTLKQEENISLNTIYKMKYIDGILKEALRLYSLAPFITRTLQRDAELCNYLIPAGANVMTSLLTMGRDPKNFTDPDLFQPERWWLNRRGKGLKSMETNHDLKAYTPWAYGGRSCIGRKIAEFNLSFLILEALKTFEWTVEEEIDPVMRLITIPGKDVILNLKPL